MTKPPEGLEHPKNKTENAHEGKNLHQSTSHVTNPGVGQSESPKKLFRGVTSGSVDEKKNAL